MSKEEILQKNHTISSPVFGYVQVDKSMDEFAEQTAIEFRTWMDNKGYFAQWKDALVGYVRQENQLCFSSWRSINELYQLYLKDKSKEK
jgi:hypothetical protein